MLLSVKFTRASTSTRIVNFFTRPKWSDLANKIKEVFHIPAEKVAIEVLAPAEDCMVAISNDKELCDYYRSLGGSSELLFVVHNKDSPDRASPFSAGVPQIMFIAPLFSKHARNLASGFNLFCECISSIRLKLRNPLLSPWSGHPLQSHPSQDERRGRLEKGHRD